MYMYITPADNATIMDDNITHMYMQHVLVCIAATFYTQIYIKIDYLQVLKYSQYSIYSIIVVDCLQEMNTAVL